MSRSSRNYNQNYYGAPPRFQTGGSSSNAPQGGTFGGRWNDEQQFHGGGGGGGSGSYGSGGRSFAPSRGRYGAGGGGSGGGGGGYGGGGYGGNGFGQGGRGGGRGRGGGSGGGGGRGGEGGRGGGRGGGGGGRGGGRGGNPGPPVPPSRNLPVRPPRIEQVARLTTGQGGGVVVEPEQRLDYGSVGSNRKTTLSTNCFDLKISDNQLEWYKYEVRGDVYRTSSRPDGSAGRPPREPPKSVLRQFWTALENNEKAGVSGFFGGIRPAYDGKSACFTTKPLPGGDNIIIPSLEAPDRPNQRFSVVIKNPVRVELRHLRNFITNRGDADLGHVSDALAALNTLFRHGPAVLFETTRTSFFVSDEAARKINRPEVEKQAKGVGGGIELWRGFFQSVRTCSMGLQLNLDTTSTAFIKAGTLSDFCVGFLEEQTGQRGSLSMLNVQTLGGSNLIRLNRVLKRLEIIVNRGQSVPKLKMKLRRRGIERIAPAQYEFDTPNGRMNVETYMYTQFGIRLRDPDLPIVEVKGGTFYPLELIDIAEGNKYSKKLSPAQQVAASEFQILHPQARLGAVVKTREHILQAVSHEHLTAFGVSLDPDRKLVEGRILPPPEIAYNRPDVPASAAPNQRSAFVEPHDGAWQMRASKGSFEQHFVKRAELRSIGVIIPDSRDYNEREVCNSLNVLFGQMSELGCSVDRSLHHLSPRIVYRCKRNDRPHDAVQKAIEYGQEAFHGQVPSIIFWFFAKANSPEYAPFKQRCTELGIGSQALQKKVCDKLGQRDVQTIVNVAMKVNCKTRGYNFHLKNGTTGGVLETKNPLVMGADLSHEMDKPSIAAMVASMHDEAVLYEEAIKVQALVEPRFVAPNAHARKSEIIVEMKEMALFLLKRRVFALGKVPPEMIVFYRDGVSESEFEAVIKNEVPALRAACTALKTDKDCVRLLGSEALTNWAPKITYIACLKRHHIRAFEDHVRAFEDDGTRTISNIAPGTVIDTGVTDARAFDWYAASHKGLIGTTRPTRYVVLVDEHPIKLTADELETLCHSLTHGYQRANRAVSVPAPVYYADLIAARVHDWLYPKDAPPPPAVMTRQLREQDLKEAKEILKSTEAGRESFRGSRQKGLPAMWWI